MTTDELLAKMDGLLYLLAIFHYEAIMSVGDLVNRLLSALGGGRLLLAVIHLLIESLASGR